MIQSPQHLERKHSATGTLCWLNFKIEKQNIVMLQIAMCTGVEEDDKLEVIFCKICDETGKKFRINADDISFIT